LEALCLLDVEAEVPRAGDDEDQPEIAYEDRGDPSGCEALHRCRIWRQPQPCDDRDRDVSRGPREQIAFPAEQPLEKAQRIERPHEDRHRSERVLWLPVAAPVALM